MEPHIPLAVSMHTNKGVYAVLLGSGASREARILTGWGIVLNLIQRVARLEHALEDSAADLAEWYRERFDEEPNYSALLQRLAGTPSERQQLLRAFFEPSEQERDDGVKVPTDAHRAIAELVAGGYIRVIVTTNFDRLMEQALEAVGVAPQVLSTPDAIGGAMPMVHSQCTIVKLHGDYLDTRIRNTTDELDLYDERVDRLLDQILDEYGLIICGWSADWDTALRAAIERAPNRRFSTYWAFPRALTEGAERLADHRGAIKISGVTASAFFRRLAEDVKSLEELVRTQPLSAKLAAQTVKRYLPHDAERIRLHDLLMDEVSRVRAQVTDPTVLPLNGSYVGEELEGRLRRIQVECANLMAMFAVAGYWTDKSNRGPWIEALTRLLSFQDPHGAHRMPSLTLRRYPALLAAYASGISALAAGRLDALVDLLNEPKYVDSNSRERTPLVIAASPAKVLGPDFQKRLPGLDRDLTPFSRYLWSNSGLRDALQDILPDEETYTATFDYFEYLAGLLAHDVFNWAPVGFFVLRGGGIRDTEYLPVCIQLNSEIERMGEELPLLQAGAFGGSLDRLRSVKAAYEARFTRY